MASKIFNPETRVDSGKEYDFRGMEADRSFGTLLKGAANILDEGIKGGVRSVTQGIQQEAYAEEKNIQDNLFATEKVAAAQASTTAGGQAMPEDLTRGFKEAMRLKEGYMKGHIRESDYLANIDVLSKRMRSKYGLKWQNEIDDAIGAAMSTTANKFRKQLFSEWDKDASDASENSKALRSLVNQYPEHYAAYPEMWQNPENYTREQHLAVIGPREAEKWNVTQMRNVASLTDENTDRGKKAREASLRTDTQHMMDTLTDVAGRPLLIQLNEKIKEFGKDEHFSKEEKAQLDNFLREAKTQLYAGVNKIMSDPLYMGLDDNVKNSQFAHVDRQIGLFNSMIHDEHSGVMVANLNKRKRVGEDVYQKWIDTNPNVANITTTYEAARAGGFADLVDEALREQIRTAGGLGSSDEIEKGITLFGQAMVTGGADRLNEFSEWLYNHPDLADAEGAKMFMTGVDMMTKAITDDRTPVITKHRAARALFSPSGRPFLSHQDEASAEALYFSIITPGVIGSLKSLKETDALSWQNFRTWAVEEGFNTLFKQDADTIVGENGGNVRFDATTLSFSQTTKRPSGSGSGRAGGMALGQWDMVQARLQKLNRWVQRIRPVIEADGQEPTEVLRKLFEERSFKTERSAADSLVNRYLKSLPAEETDAEGKTKEK